jgi:F-type H+-transporting ATPase subunit epsilon
VASINVEAIAADHVIWEGEASTVIARTTEGDVGILAGHEPFLAVIVPCIAEVVEPDGNRIRIFIDQGFISVEENRVSLLSQFGELVSELKLDEVKAELAKSEAEAAADPANARAARRVVRAKVALNALEPQH